jgi:hypothetical protein
VMPRMVLTADLLMPFMVFFAQRRSTWEGFILALFCSHLYSLSSSAPIAAAPWPVPCGATRRP